MVLCSFPLPNRNLDFGEHSVGSCSQGEHPYSCGEGAA